MTDYIKDSEDFGVFILESDAIDNEDWVGDHDDMKEADLAFFTSGTNFIHLPYITNFKHAPAFVFDLIDFFKGEASDVSLGEGHDLVLIEGKYGYGTEANRNEKKEHLMLVYWNHLDFSTNQLYLGVRKRGEVWEKFINKDLASKNYCVGKLIEAQMEREEGQNFYTWRIAFRGIG